MRELSISLLPSIRSFVLIGSFGILVSFSFMTLHVLYLNWKIQAVRKARK